MRTQESCELPEGIKLPLKTIEDLHSLERQLDDTETKTLTVNSYSFVPLIFLHHFFSLCIKLGCVVLFPLSPKSVAK